MTSLLPLHPAMRKPPWTGSRCGSGRRIAGPHQCCSERFASKRWLSRSGNLGKIDVCRSDPAELPIGNPGIPGGAPGARAKLGFEMLVLNVGLPSGWAG